MHHLEQVEEVGAQNKIDKEALEVTQSRCKNDGFHIEFWRKPPNLAEVPKAVDLAYPVAEAQLPPRPCGAPADASATTNSKESGQARVRSGVRPQLRDAAVTPPVTPAWLQSPEHLRRPGDFRSHCHAPARLWPPESSTDSLEPRTIGPPAAPVCSRPAPCQRTFKGKRSR